LAFFAKDVGDWEMGGPPPDRSVAARVRAFEAGPSSWSPAAAAEIEDAQVAEATRRSLEVASPARLAVEELRQKLARGEPVGPADPGDPSLTPLQRAEARIHNLVLRADRLLAESGNARLRDRGRGREGEGSSSSRAAPPLTREEENEAVCRFFAAPGDLASLPLAMQIDALVADVDALGAGEEGSAGHATLSVHELEARCGALRAEAEARGSDEERERMSHVADYLSSYAASIRQQDFRDCEDELLSRLNETFEVVLVPGGGSECLFVACSLAQQAARLVAEAKVTPEEAAEACREEVRSRFASLRQAAAKLRADAVRTLRKKEQFHDAIVDQLILAVSTASRKEDETTVRVRRELRQRHPGRTDDEIREELARVRGKKGAGPKRRAIEAYLAVMADEGTFGERTEVAALSSLMKRPVRVFYYTPGANEAVRGASEKRQQLERTGAGDSEKAAEGGNPAGARLPVEVFGHKYETQPIDLFHETTNRHFHILIPRTASAAWRSAPLFRG